jgi:hypothetical protein
VCCFNCRPFVCFGRWTGTVPWVTTRQSRMDVTYESTRAGWYVPTPGKSGVCRRSSSRSSLQVAIRILDSWHSVTTTISGHGTPAGDRTVESHTDCAPQLEYFHTTGPQYTYSRRRAALPVASTLLETTMNTSVTYPFVPTWRARGELYTRALQSTDRITSPLCCAAEERLRMRPGIQKVGKGRGTGGLRA